MLRPAGQLLGYRLVDREGIVGSVEDFHIYCPGWSVRHAAIFTGEWLSGRWVLVPIELLGPPDPLQREVSLLIMRERIRIAPVPESDRPPSSLFESALYRHYGVPPPQAIPRAGQTGLETSLWSLESVRGCQVDALDMEVGRVDDYLLDDSDWRIRYLIVNLRRWMPGRKVVVPVAAIRLLSWKHRRIALGLSRDGILAAPRFEGPGSLSEEYQNGLESYFAAVKS